MGIRQVDNKNPERHRVLKYLREHPKELRYIVGDFISKRKLKVIKNTDDDPEPTAESIKLLCTPIKKEKIDISEW